MQGIEGVTARFAHIQATMAAMAPPIVAPRTVPATSGTSFAAALNGALASTARTSASTALNGALASTARISASTALDSDGVPTSLAAYGNGKIPEHALSTVGNTGHRLWAPAAEALERMTDTARRDGVTIGITDSYRPYAEQVDLVRRKGLYSQGGLAAKPGTSDHGWGMAADLNLNVQAQSWMRANGPRFGFHEDTPREPWHWGFKTTS